VGEEFKGLPDCLTLKGEMPMNDLIEVKDDRLLGFFIVDNDIFSKRHKISAYGLLLYCLLCRLSKDLNGTPLRRSYLSAMSRMSAGSVSKAAKELIDLGLISIEERRDGKVKLPSVYTLKSLTVTSRRSCHDGHEVTIEMINKKREINNKVGTTSPHVEAVRRVFEHYVKVMDKNPKLYTFTDQRKKTGLARFADCLKAYGGDAAKAEKVMTIVVDKVADTPFHMGKNDRNRKYNDWVENIFKNTDKMEWWINREMEGIN
jgi:hypothetical protein